MAKRYFWDDVKLSTEDYIRIYDGYIDEHLNSALIKYADNLKKESIEIDALEEEAMKHYHSASEVTNSIQHYQLGIADKNREVATKVALNEAQIGSALDKAAELRRRRKDNRKSIVVAAIGSLTTIVCEVVFRHPISTFAKSMGGSIKNLFKKN